MLAVGMLLIGAAGAQATVGVEINGPTLIVTGSTGDDVPQFDFREKSGQPYVRVFDPGEVVGALPAGCDRDDSSDNAGDIKQEPPYVALCPAGSLANLAVVLGDGNDGPFFGICMTIIAVDLGEGTNNVRAPGCSAATTFSVGSGAGQDTVSADSGTLSSIQAELGAGDDTFFGGDGDDIAQGGEGDDYLVSSAGNDQHFGEGGNDDIMGGPGNDVEDGGPGDDRIGYSAGVSNDDDQGADTLRGGDGTDKLLLDAHTGGMTISIDGQPNDGAPGEGDDVGADFEQIDGTTANDVFFGSPGPDQFSGGSGNDEIHGGDGPDSLYGGSSDDRIFGDGGSDKVEGASGADTVDGGAGTDQIYGDIAACSLFCSFDSDELFARDGERDAVDCGGGADTAHVDGLDVVAFCTAVDRQDAPGSGGPGPGPGGGGGAAAALGLQLPASIKTRTLLKRGMTFRLTCPGACKITGELRFKSKKLGSARKSLLAAGPAKLVVKLSKKAKRRIRRAQHGKLKFRLKVTDAAGAATTVTKTVRFKR
jgi:Ca2+-binding RTX toxin-like protein